MKNTVKGIFCIIGSAFCFALMAVFVKLSGDIYFVQKTFFRNFVAFFVAVLMLAREARKNGFGSLKLPEGVFILLIARSITGTVGIFGNFYAVDNLLLSDAAMLNKMSPFFTLVFSCFLLKEKLKPLQIFAVCGAFAGAMLIIKPGFQFSSSTAAAAGFASGLGAGFAHCFIRKLSQKNCNGTVIIAFFSAFSMAVTLPYIIFNFQPMTVRQVILLLCAGVAATGGQFGITAAYFAAPAREISIFDYSQIIFSASLGFFLFGQIPDILSFTGYAVIILMAVINFLYNKKLHHQMLLQGLDETSSRTSFQAADKMEKKE